MPWARLVAFGPSRFAAYARLRHVPDPEYQGQSENEIDVQGTWWADRDQLATLMQVLRSHTTTPEDCYVCVWEGYADTGGAMPLNRGEHPGAQAGPPLWYPDEASSANTPQPSPFAQPAPYPGPRPRPEWPQVVVPNRAYFLFRGRLADVYDWGAADVRWGPPAVWVGQTRVELYHPAFVWPADHAWCVAGDVDAHWSGIGADTRVVDQLVSDGRLDVVAADPETEQQEYR